MAEQNEHWNQVYSNQADTQLGWFESDVSQTLKFFDAIPNTRKLRVFLPGAGTSLLVEELLARENDVILNDISSTALERLKTRIGADSATWLIHDISTPLPKSVSDIELWIDRAVLHFLTDDAEIECYFDNVRSSVVVGGYVLLAEFSENGHTKCAGLEVHRYSLEEMNARMGEKFELSGSEHFEFKMPSGDSRPYLYALYKRLT